MASSSKANPLLEVPLFPLPNVVLFPRAVLPLHVFEQRYRQMTSDVLAGPKRVAMALLKPGWEKSYYGKPELEPVVCVGAIVSHERLPDGKFNFVLQGQTRARIVREVRIERPYRMAELEALEEVPASVEWLDGARRDFERLLGGPRAGAMECASQLRRLLDSSLTAADIADLVAFGCLDDVPLKQSLLGECNVQVRISRVLEALKTELDRASMMDAAARQANLN